MNYADSDRIRMILNSSGLNEVKNFVDADLIVLNSCSVRKQAEDKIAGWGIKRKKLKKKFLLTGCMAVRHDRKEGGLLGKHTRYINRKYPWLDYVVDITEIEKIPEILGLKKNIKVFQKDYLNILPQYTSNIIANIPISTGCDFFCSYCIVPFSRGKLLQREYSEIIREVNLSLENGVKLICLVAQNVNSWIGMKDGKKIGFAELLEDIAKIEGDFWITFVSSNPMDFSEKVIQVISANPKIMRWINIALQSGSDDVLKRMNRRYTKSEFEDLMSRIKKDIPDARLTTDIIVGFPGESESDFQKTVDIIKKIEFEMLYIGKYSPRKLAASSLLEDDVPLIEKKRREEILKVELNKMRDIFHKDLIGKKMKILVTGGRRGLSYFYHEVLFEENVKKEAIGTFVDAIVTKSSLSGLVAKV
jgi:tRNA-2-methylthio-N6-dimethylallyladenosine synthase